MSAKPSTAEATAWAHEVVPHPGEGESKPLEYLVRYHYAQAQAWHHAFANLVGTTYGPENDFALSQYLRHSHLAFLHDALLQGKTGQEAAEWAARRCHPESPELVWERGAAHGLDVDSIRPYETSRK